MRVRHLLVKATTLAAVLSISATSVTAMALPTNPAAGVVPGDRIISGAPIRVEPLPSMAMPKAAPKAVNWPSAEKSEVDVSSAAPARKAGSAPVAVAGKQDAKVQVETFGQDVSGKAGIAGVLMKVSAPPVAGKGLAKDAKTSVRLDYSGFANAYGGDYGSRLVFQQYPECVLSTPDRPECRVPTPVASTNNVKHKELSAEIAAAGQGVVLAAAAAEAGSGGSYGSTSLAPSGSWSAGDSSGNFSYSVPMTMPIAPAGPAPTLSLSYSSANVDGRTSATNNQASWAGDGWDLSAGGFIERTMVACANDTQGSNQGDTKTGDLCWKGDEYTISLAGVSGKLIKDSSGRLRPERDDGSRIEKLGDPANGYKDGEYWKVTTLDGTQYFLGRNTLPGLTTPTNSVLTEPVYGNQAGEPCNKPAYADSVCTQAYRWSVDLVIDPRGNAMVFYYDKETNYYKRGGFRGVNSIYDAAGRLNRIEWGLRENALSAKASARVVFETAERCLPSGAITCAPEQLTKNTASSWPDVPFDRICAPGEDCTDRYSPAFFTRKRLTRVLTQSLKPDGSDYTPVDAWSLRQEFPPTGDGMAPALWLSGVKRTGYVGGSTAEVPEVVFSGTAMDNRVDTDSDNLLPITRYRLTQIVSEAGSLTKVGYSDRECTRATQMQAAPELNTLRCYPVYWSPPGSQDPKLDWFQKYLVMAVTEDARTGGPSKIFTRYEYIGGGAWHYDDNEEEEAKYRTWSEWRGYGRVRTIKGAEGSPQTVSEKLFLRGMDGDTMPNGGVRDVWVNDSENGRVEDIDEYKGFTRESLLYSGGKIVSAELTEPTVIETANNGKDRAVILRSKSTTQRSLQGDNTWRRTRSSMTFDDLGQILNLDNEGDIAVTGDESCSLNKYLRNNDKGMASYISSVRTIAKPCASWPGTDADVMSDVRSAYDGQPYDTPPTRGIVTESRRWTGGSNYQLVSTVKADAYGRTVESTDADGSKTTAVYTPETGNPQSVTTKNALGWETKSYLDTSRGLSLTEIGVNGERSDMVYDPLGRLVKVWQPGRNKLDDKSPTAEYSYEYRLDAPTVVTSKSITEFETYRVSYDLLDGMLRHRQSQTPSALGGRVMTDTFYDSRGNANVTNAAYYVLGDASKDLFGAFDNAVPSQTIIEFDDLGRPLETILTSMKAEKWRTKTRYSGDNTYTTPPQGGTPTAVFKNAIGAVVERRQYQSPSASGEYDGTAAYDATKYSFDAKGQLSKVTDPAGNKWEYRYDNLGRKTWDSDPDHGASTYEYNDLDQLVSTKDARGRKLVNDYDALGRRTKFQEEAPSGARTVLAEWTFDTLRKGLQTSATRYVNGNPFVQRVDRYDSLNRPDITSVVIPPSEGKLAGTYTYQSSFSSVTGQLVSESMPAVGGLPGENVIHTYNEFGQPVKTAGLNNYVHDQWYSAYGETLRLAYGDPEDMANNNPRSRVIETFTYEEGTRRLTSSNVKKMADPASVESDRSYGYDPAGNITRISENGISPADTQCFGYDSLRRMTSAWTPKSGDCTAAKSVANLGGQAPYWYDFSFDKIGNRRTQVQHKSNGDLTETYDIPASGPDSVRPHALNSVTRSGPNGTSKDEFTYDETGNTRTRKVGGNTQTLDWNAEGRVSKVTEANGQTSEYVYDAGGARLMKKEPTSTTLYLPGQEVFLGKEANAVPTAKRYYTHGGVTVAMRGSTSTDVAWLIGDHQGTTSLSFYVPNAWMTRRFMDPFGTPRGTPSRWWPDNKGLVGGDRDTTGLTSMGAREYDQATGRFMSVDPIMDTADPQQMNAYSYSNNSPVTFSDPTGLRPAECEILHESCAHPGSPVQSPIPAEQEYHNKIHDQAVKYHEAVDKQYIESQKRASEASGMSPEEIARLEEEAASKKGFWDIMKEEIPDIIGDLTGFNDLRDCFTKFDLWACASIIPWGKVLKLVRSIGKVFSAVRKALKWEERIAEAQSRLARVAELTKKYVDEGMEKLNDLRKAQADDAPSCLLHSFPPGTKVLLADGTTKPIEDIKLGDTVLTTDPTTGRTEARPVVATWIHDNEPTHTQLTIDTDGAAGTTTATLEATDWHPIWVADLKAWLPIARVEPGDRLRDSSAERNEVVRVDHLSRSGSTLDLTVEDVHTYYVLAGNTPVLVHNCGKQIYQTNPKHGQQARQTSRGGSSAAPADGQGALDNSVQIKDTSSRRVGIDPSNGDVVILDKHSDTPCGCSVEDGVNEMFHGHVRTDINTDPGMQAARNALRRAIKSGAIIVP